MSSEDIVTVDEVDVTHRVQHGQTVVESVEPHGVPEEYDGNVEVSGSVYYQLEDLGINPEAYGIFREEE